MPLNTRPRRTAGAMAAVALALAGCSSLQPSGPGPAHPARVPRVPAVPARAPVPRAAPRACPVPVGPAACPACRARTRP